jgi:hypothetical protein
MPLVLADRVRETTTVTGTSSAVLLGAVTGFQSFAVIGNGNTCYYTISDQSGPNFEVGIGTYSTSGPTLARTTILASSNSGLIVSFPAGTKDVFVTYPAEKSVNLDASDNVSPLGTVASATWNATAITTTYGGTGLTSYTAGDLSYYASGTTFTKLAIGASGYFLSSSGTAPQWTQTLGVANGGTGLNSLTTGRIPFGANTAAFGNSANLFFDSSNTRLGVGTSTPAVTAAFVGIDSILTPKGTTAERPTGVTGYLRYNTTTEEFEGFSGSPGAWKSVGGSAISNDTTTATDLFPLFASATTGTAQNVFTSNAKYLYKPSTGELQASEILASNGVILNNQTMNTSYTMPSGYSGMSTGPFVVAGGVTFTIPSGSRHVVL